MKKSTLKTLLMMAGVVMALILSSCASKVHLVQGEAAFVRQSNGFILFEMDYSQCRVVEYSFFMNKIKEDFGTVDDYNRMRGEDWVADWPKVNQGMADAFMHRFNRRNKKGMQLTQYVIDAPYKMVFHVRHLDMGSTGAAVASMLVNVLTDKYADEGGCIIDGTIDIIDNHTGEKVATMAVDLTKGEGAYSISESGRLASLLDDIGKYTYRGLK